MAAPTVTSSQTLHTSASLAASGTANDNLDIRTKFEARIQVSCNFGTVAGTNGVQVDIGRYVDGGTLLDTIFVLTFTVPGTTSTLKRQSFALPTGHYNVKYTNLDATNAVNPVIALYETTDTVA